MSTHIDEIDEDKKYAWEKKYETSWSKLIDEELSDKNVKELNEQRRKRKRYEFFKIQYFLDYLSVSLLSLREVLLGLCISLSTGRMVF